MPGPSELKSLADQTHQRQLRRAHAITSIGEARPPTLKHGHELPTFFRMAESPSPCTIELAHMQQRQIDAWSRGTGSSTSTHYSCRKYTLPSLTQHVFDLEGGHPATSEHLSVTDISNLSGGCRNAEEKHPEGSE